MRPAQLLAITAATMVSWTSLSAQDEAAEASVDEASAYRAMGWAMASQLRLNIGFTDDELSQIFEGMRSAAEGEDQPEGFKEAVATAQQLYMTKMQAFQAKEMEAAQAIAAGNKEEAAAFLATLDGNENIQKSESGLYYEIIEAGTGKAPSAQDRVKVNYKGTLIDGREFDGNNDAVFMTNRVVPGFSEGLQLLNEGGKIKLYIPPELGYGDQPSRPGSIIEPGDALIFEVELLEVVSVPTPPMGPPPNLPANLPPPPPPPSGPPPGPPPAPPSNLKAPTAPPASGSGD